MGSEDSGHVRTSHRAPDWRLSSYTSWLVRLVLVLSCALCRMTVPCLLRCLPTRSPQRPVPHFASWKTTRNFLARRKTHRTCLPCWVTLRDGPLTACCKSEEMGSVASALSRASVSGVGHLFSRGGATCFVKSFSPWTWSVLEETRGQP